MEETDEVVQKFSKDLMETAAKSNWGSFRNVVFEMAESYNKSGEKRDALERYLEILYLDINGPCNREGVTDPEILREFPPFDPAVGFIAPAVGYEIKKLMKELNISYIEIKDTFFHTSEQLQKALSLPISPKEAWSKQETDEACGISDIGM